MQPHRKPAVLIADDNLLMRGALALILTEIGARDIVLAADGNETVKLYRERSPDIVFLDIRMPGKDGLAALKEIKTIDASAFVVMVSAYGSIENVKAAIKAGANGFVVKPYNMNRIVAMMNRYQEMHGRSQSASVPNNAARHPAV